MERERQSHFINLWRERKNLTLLMYGERENNLTLLMYRERKKTEQMGFVFFTSNCLKRQKKTNLYDI